MDDKNEVVEPVEENLELPAVEEGEEDTTDYKAEALKLRDKAIAQRERTKALKKELSDTKRAVEIAAGIKKEPTPVKTGELDETQLDYLDLKGVNEQEDIDYIEKVVKREGLTVRQALKDDMVIAKLAAHKAKREVLGATPGSTKRAGGQVGDVASAAAKFKETGVLPDDRALANAVVDSIAVAGNDRLPSWQR
jgi:hypothetical protein